MCSTYTDVGRYCYSTSKHCYAAGVDATALCNIGTAAAAAATASSRDNLKELRSSFATTAQHKCCYRCCCCTATQLCHTMHALRNCSLISDTTACPQGHCIGACARTHAHTALADHIQPAVCCEEPPIAAAVTAVLLLLLAPLLLPLRSLLGASGMK
jgi:hypothetical protein